jgi:hypothetical protein
MSSIWFLCAFIERRENHAIHPDTTIMIKATTAKDANQPRSLIQTPPGYRPKLEIRWSDSQNFD